MNSKALATGASRRRVERRVRSARIDEWATMTEEEFHKESMRMAVHAAMVDRVDQNVGRLVEKLERLEELENTLILFLVDNGPHASSGTLEKFKAAGPLRAKKGSVCEGGIRVPFVARWPGKIKPGTVSDHASCFQDMMPTFAELAGGKVPKDIDGISMVAALFGRDGQKKHEYLYWELGSKQALRRGDWKAVRSGKKSKLGPVELYNLAEDIGEMQDLAASEPERAKEMESLLKEARRPSELFPNKLFD